MQRTAENRGTVLIVDDNPAVLFAIQQILIAAHYRVLLAAERAGAIRLARQKHIHIDAILLDVRMPGVSGSELADEILSMRPDVRVLWMSGFVDEDFIRIKLLDGYNGLFTRPVRCDGLLAAVQDAVDAMPCGSLGAACLGEAPLMASAASYCP